LILNSLSVKYNRPLNYEANQFMTGKIIDGQRMFLLRTEDSYLVFNGKLEFNGAKIGISELDLSDNRGIDDIVFNWIYLNG